MNRLFGGMEGGGSKFVCAVGSGPENILETCQFPTTNPKETLEKAVNFFKKFPLSAIGLSTFGPLDLGANSPTFGRVMHTPKPGWVNANILQPFREKFDLPIAFDMDVNAAAYGEYTWVPENYKLDVLVYYTVGTGIGAGIILNKKISHGLTHSEAGHMRIPHNRKLDPFPGICPFHGDCFEGLASGPALATRWRKTPEELPEKHPAWDLEAHYIALAMVNTILILSPQRIILGGGVMGNASLFPMVKQKVQDYLNNYISSPFLDKDIDQFIVPPALGNMSGVLGAISMAKNLDKIKKG